jgi:hypothetical protein
MHGMVTASAAPSASRAEAALVAAQAESLRGRAAGCAFDGAGPRAVAGRLGRSAGHAAWMELGSAGRERAED